jgi:hypothetical protein
MMSCTVDANALGSALMSADRVERDVGASGAEQPAATTPAVSDAIDQARRRQELTMVLRTQ